MEKKSWKKRLLTQLIVLLVVAVIFALSLLTADNQMQAWIESQNNEISDFVNQYGNKGYITEDEDEAKSDRIVVPPVELSNISNETASEVPVKDAVGNAEDLPPVTSAEDQGNSLKQPQADHSSALSPDNRYMAETYGANTNITAGGLYPSEKIRIRDMATDEILWEMMGFYGCKFLWTADSRRLSVSYTARIYGNTVIVDTADFTEIMVPVPEQITGQMQEDRPDIYLYGEEWVAEGKLLMNFRYTAKDSMEYRGNFIFDPATGETEEFQVTETR